MSITPTPPAQDGERDHTLSHYEFVSLDQMSGSWLAVVDVLDETCPGWADKIGSGEQNAVDAIRTQSAELAALRAQAVGAGQPVLAYCVLYRDGTEELTWPNKDGTRDDNSDEWHGEPKSVIPLSSQAPKPASAGGELDAIELHPATKMLVHNFALALAEKLAAAEKKYGYGDNWARLDWADECREHLREHVEKGDPRDVAAYCAFLWFHGERTAIAAEADTAKDDPSLSQLAADYADDIAARQRALTPSPPDRLAPIEARDAVTDAEVEHALDIWCNKPVTDDTNLLKSLRDRARAVLETFLRARESSPAVEPYAAKGILLALALCGAMGSARADSLRVDAAGIGVKYEGAVAAILEPTATSPAVLVFQQGSGLPIGGGPQLPPRPGSVPFVLEFTRPDGSGVALACVGPPPAFDGAEFHAHFVCKVQPD